ncbi:MAG: PASTA domain-containing protein [Acidobacteria bacterium]|nr:PASTA domain-containing protein [Acidobacteriota bacterium]
MSFARTLWTIIKRLLVLAMLLLVFVASTLTTLYFSRGKEVVVPKMIGKKQNDAISIAKTSGLQVDTIEIIDETSPSGIVLRQEPKPGMIVKQGYIVKVYLTNTKN